MRRALVCLALVVLVARFGVTASGADFATTAKSPGNAFVSAADFNTVVVDLRDPGPMLRGTAALEATATSERGVASVRFQTSPAGAGSWTDACVDAAEPFVCDFDTAGVVDGVHDLRAIAVDQAGYTRTSAVVASRRIDNTAPSMATLINPGTSLQGSVSLSGHAADAGSGIAAWTVQHRLSGATTWNDACSDAATPYSCGWDTAGVADGVYDVRALARDQAGNTTGSTVRTGIRVDNVVPVVALADPGSPLVGTVTVAATATDGGGVASVTIERSAAGANSWTAICTDTTASFSCAFDTTQVAEGSYDLRARATDNAGRTATSAIVAARAVDHVPRGMDIQATNGGSISGQLEAGDTVRFTFSEPIAPASILAGWTGASQAIRVTLADSGSADTMDFLDSAGTTRLGLVDAAGGLGLDGDFVTSSSAVFDATIAMSGNTALVTLGSRISGTVATASNGRMTWRPSAAARDLAGLAMSTALVTESGGNDRDF